MQMDVYGEVGPQHIQLQDFLPQRQQIQLPMQLPQACQPQREHRQELSNTHLEYFPPQFEQQQPQQQQPQGHWANGEQLRVGLQGQPNCNPQPYYMVPLTEDTTMTATALVRGCDVLDPKLLARGGRQHPSQREPRKGNKDSSAARQSKASPVAGLNPQYSKDNNNAASGYPQQPEVGRGQGTALVVQSGEACWDEQSVGGSMCGDMMQQLATGEPKENVRTMREQLEALRLEDPRTVFIARHIHKLGFASADVLRVHFARYGEVKNVLVSHSRVKTFQSRGRRRRGVGEHQRLRAAGLGFVIMGSAEVTAKIMREDTEHVVNGVHVQITPYNPMDDASQLSQPALGGGDEYDDYAVLEVRERFHSPGSDTSNRSYRGGEDYAVYASDLPCSHGRAATK